VVLGAAGAGLEVARDVRDGVERTRGAAVAEVDLAALRSAGIVPQSALGAKIIVSGKLSRKLSVKGDVKASKGARAAIESAGGTVEVLEPKVEAKPKKDKKKPKPEAKGAEEGQKA